LSEEGFESSHPKMKAKATKKSETAMKKERIEMCEREQGDLARMSGDLAPRRPSEEGFESPHQLMK
jgi:hypothetical protein